MEHLQMDSKGTLVKQKTGVAGQGPNLIHRMGHLGTKA